MHAHSRCFVLNVVGVRRTYRRERVRVKDAGLHERHAAMVFDAVDRKARGGKRQIGDPMRIEDALKCEVVNRENGRRWALAGERCVRRRQAGLPIVRMKDVCAPFDGAARGSDQRGRPREEAEAQGVVRPVPAVRIEVRAAAPIVERRTVDDPRWNALRQETL